MRTRLKNRLMFCQRGQSMVEYTLVLVFGVLVLTSGPGQGAIGALMNVIQMNYQGYSYAVSLSEIPDHDSLGAYLTDTGVVDPIDPTDVVNQITNYTSFPSISSFPTDLFPTSPQDVLDGATSFF